MGEAGNEIRELSGGRNAKDKDLTSVLHRARGPQLHSKEGPSFSALMPPGLPTARDGGENLSDVSEEEPPSLLRGYFNPPPARLG